MKKFLASVLFILATGYAMAAQIAIDWRAAGTGNPTRTYLNNAPAVIYGLQFDVTGLPSLTSIASGIGDVIGPAGAVNSRIALFDGVTGKLLKDSGSNLADVLDRFNHTGTQEWNTLTSTLDDPVNSIDSRIAGKTGTNADKVILSAISPNVGYTRSVVHWAAGVDLTPISVWCGQGGVNIGNTNGFKRATAISPRHVLMANHYKPPIGTTFDWVTNANVKVTRTLIAGMQVGITDIYIGLLDSDLPNTIGFCRVMPVVNPFQIIGYPAFILDQEWKALVFDIKSNGASPVFDSPTDPTRLGFYEPIINHDSSNPVCVIYGTELVVLCTVHNPTFGPSLTVNRTDIDAALVTLGGGHTVTDADPSEGWGDVTSSNGGAGALDSGRIARFGSNGELRSSGNSLVPAFDGINSGGGIGVRGDAVNSIGVYGLSTASGTGVVGQGTGTADGLAGVGDAGYGGTFQSESNTALVGQTTSGTNILELNEGGGFVPTPRLAVRRSDGRLTFNASTYADAPVASGSMLTSASGLDATNITSGTLGTARLGTGTANNTTYLRGDQTWATVAAGAGDVVGPASAVTGRIATFNGITGKLLQDGGATIADLLTTSAAALAYQPLDPDLTTWSGITRAANVGTFLATPTSANLALAVTNESGTGALLFADGAIGNATGTSLSFGADPADAGDIRMSNGDSILWEASPAGTDVGISVNALEQIVLTNQFDAPSGQFTGTAGAGFITLVGQSSAPTSPAPGTILLHGTSANGFTRLEQDNESGTMLVIGRDSVTIARNTSGVAVAKGEVVYVTGSTGNVPNIAKAQANASATTPGMYVVVDAISNNAFGQVMRSGIISGFDTAAIGSAGAAVFLSPTTAGGLTTTRPSGTTNIVQRVGTILVSNVATGSLDVSIAPALLNIETGTNAATWTGNAIAATTGNFTGMQSITMTNSKAATNTITGLGTTTVDGLQVTNTTAAAAGAQQVSPAIHWTGQGWKTDATAASQSVDFKTFILPVQGAANPTGTWKLQKSINGGAYSDAFAYSGNGRIDIDTSNSSAACAFFVGGTPAWEYYGGSGYGNQPMNITASGGITIIGTSKRLKFNLDAILEYDTTAVIQMGIDAAAPVAQTFKGTDARAGTDTDTAGGTMSIAAGRGTGTGLGGTLKLQTAAATTTGTAAGTLTDRLTIGSVGTITIPSAGAASAPAMVVSGVPYAAGTATTNFPLVYLNEAAATASTTLSTAGTMFGINKDTNTGLLMDLMQDGVTKFKVDAAAGPMITIGTGGIRDFGSGQLGVGGTSAAYLYVASASIQAINRPFSWGTTIGSPTTYIYEDSTAVLQMGADAAAPVAQTFKGPDARAATDTDTAGGNMSIAAGRGTGTGAGGVLQLQAAVPTTTGTAAGTLTTRATVRSDGVFIDDATSKAADDTYTGRTLTGLTNTGGITQWDAIYLNSSSQWVRADADGASTYPVRGLATSTQSTGAAVTVIRDGVIRNDAWAWTPGGTVYLTVTGTADNTLSQTAPATPGDKIQVIGFALDDNTLCLDISTDYGTAP